MYFSYFSRLPQQPLITQEDDDDVTWGSEELPIESINQPQSVKGRQPLLYSPNG